MPTEKEREREMEQKNNIKNGKRDITTHAARVD